MPAILLALDSCAAAFELAPLAEALAQAGTPPTIAWFGPPAALADARALGLPEPLLVADAKASEQRSNHGAAAEFAECVLDAGPWRVVATTGHGAFAVALTVAAAMRGTPAVRLDAGQRSHTADAPAEQRRRIADHAAVRWLVASQAQRAELSREGLPSGAIDVVGSYLPQALAACIGAPSPNQAFALLACEHGDDDALRATLTPLASASGLTVRTTGELPATAQLTAARDARAIVTDSAGYQQLAAVLGVPCIFVGERSARPETVSAGRCRVAAATATQLAEALGWAVRAERDRPPLYANAVPATVAILQAMLGPTAAKPTTAAQAGGPNLPSDGDITGRTFDAGEDRAVLDVLRTGTLNSTRGTAVTRFEREFAAWLGRKHAIACASGSAAVHCAIAALRLAAGDEVITTPITDMGALTPIFYEGAVPVFADVDPTTWNVTAATIEAQITDRTRAIVVTHLFGSPCDLDAILALAERHGLPVVEDAAQAFGASFGGRKVGTFGRLAAFSLQQGKHITTGEGGIVCTDDDELARRVFLFVNKAWGYGDPQPDHYFPALNYRMTELQGAVAWAQLPKLDGVVAARRTVAAALRRELADLPGIACPDDPPRGEHSYWKFAFRVDAGKVPGGAVALGKRMREQGIACVPRYIQKPAFECQLFRDWRSFPVMALPLGQNPRGVASGPLFDRSAYPGAVAGLEHVVVLPINERYLPEHVAIVAVAIRSAHRELGGG